MGFVEGGMAHGCMAVTKSGGLGTATRSYVPWSFAPGGPREPARIAVSIGDPAGVGAEIALKALADRELLDVAEWVVIGDHAALEAAVAGYRENVDPRIRFVMAARLDPAKPIASVNCPLSTALPRSSTSAGPPRCALPARRTPWSRTVE